MKTIQFKYLTLFFLVVLTLGSCTKNKVEPSRPTYLPFIKINGNLLVTLIVGDTYTDAGASVTEGGVPITLNTENPVDDTQPGVYKVVYSAVNVDGVEGSASRTVIVLPGAVTNDVNYIEGKYKTNPLPPAGSAPQCTISNISKVTAGVYYTENCWGSGSAAVLPAYFFCLDGVSLEIPLQGSGAGAVVTSGGPGVYDVANSKIIWTITRPFFPGGAITRTKTWTKV